MPWLWFAGPFVALLIYVLMSFWPSAEEKRINGHVSRWLDEYLGPLRVAKKIRNRRVRALPPALDAITSDAGGTRMADIVLVPKHAYLAVRLSDAGSSTNYHSVLCTLAKPAPAFTCRPIPVVEGRSGPNPGITFKADPAFTATFLVEGEQPKPITKWLSPELREAMLDLPDVFLEVRSNAMALTVHGTADPEKLDQLVDIADAIFAEHGASSASLFGDDKPAKKKKKEPAPPEEAAPAPLRLRANAIDFALYAVAALLLVTIVGKFASFHPPVFFNSPDIDPTEQWQGGWTTKGMGAFIIAESFLVGVFAYQSYVGAHNGQSIGMRLLGLRVLGPNGGAPGFVHGVLLRRWIFSIPLFVVAASFARPLKAATFFEQLVRWPTMVAGALVLAGLAAMLLRSADGAGIHDRVSKTRVVLADRWHLPAIQLGTGGAGVDPLAFARLARTGGLIVGWILLNLVVVGVLNAGYWPGEAPYRFLEWAAHTVRGK